MHSVDEVSSAIYSSHWCCSTKAARECAKSGIVSAVLVVLAPFAEWLLVATW